MANVTLPRSSKTFPISRKNAALTAVTELDVAIRHGAFMVLVGPSDCGKFTTQQKIASPDEATGGSITIDAAR